jgi:rare lipoprotein A
MIKSLFIMLCCSLLLIGCGGGETIKPTPKPATSKPAKAPETTGDSTKKPGGFYLDDGPGDNPPADIDAIPDAQPKAEPLLPRANVPYKALGQTYVPMTISQPYKERGIASWYGKRYHGKKTSSGEIYDMYGMTAAHTILPLPSYAKVTNPANGRSVIVRVNDRGPFKSNRLIDLSYAAAYKLRLTGQGSGLVEVEAINPAQYSATAVKPSSPPTSAPAPAPAVQTQPIDTAPPSTNPPVTTSTAAPPPAVKPVADSKPASEPIVPTPVGLARTLSEYFIQIGAFKSQANAELLTKKIQGLDFEQDKGISQIYTDGLYRLKIGPYETKQNAEQVAADIRRRLNIPTYITNQ